MKFKPIMQMCYLCGQEFGSLSLPIHQPCCLQRFLHQNQLKKAPSPPKCQPGTPEHNAQAYLIYKRQVLQACPNCKRTFMPQSLVKHKKGCVKDQEKMRSYTFKHREPRAVVCFGCGNRYTLPGFGVHLRTCAKNARKRGRELELPPQMWEIVLDMDWTDKNIKKFNEFSSSYFAQRNYKLCQQCGCKFEQQIFYKHQGNCKAEKPRRDTLKFKNIPII